jgi:antibiotic biosynthesis monooxygenase (ABM) superfamily enzyme
MNQRPSNQATQPKRWKLAIVVWAAMYPTVTAIVFLVYPVDHQFPLPVQTFIVSALTSPLLVFIWIPFLTRRFASWLRA